MKQSIQFFIAGCPVPSRVHLPAPRSVALSVGGDMPPVIRFADPNQNVPARENDMPDNQHWVGTWTTAPAPAEGTAFSNQTLRMNARTSLGGTTVRVRVLNA